MANKRDVERARVRGMYDLLAQYRSCRAHGQDEATALDSIERYIKCYEWGV